jgi:hypothetical protein
MAGLMCNELCAMYGGARSGARKKRIIAHFADRGLHDRPGQGRPRGRHQGIIELPLN